MVVTKAAQELPEAAKAFTVPLRLGEGFDEQRFNELCQALRCCARDWSRADLIPKTAANVLVDLAPAIESCSYLSFYDSNESQQIRDAAQTVADLVRSCVASAENDFAEQQG